MMLKHSVIPYARQRNPGVDRNDPKAAPTAIELQFPRTFCERAWDVINYFDDTMFLYAYKGHFVVIDESLYLTDHGDGSDEAPLGGPRWVGDTLEDLEKFLLALADCYDADGDVPGWKTVETPQPQKQHWHTPSPNVLVKFTRSGEFVGVKTYSRQLGSHGRFLIYHKTLQLLMDDSAGLTKYEEDCGDYVKIVRLKDAMQFSFAWLNTYGDGSIKGIRQELTIPLSVIRLALNSSEMQRYLYSPPPRIAAIDARPAADTLHEIMQDKQIRRAFSKAMRDCFRWPGEHVTLYRDGKYSFYFVTRSGFPKCGGLILHEGEQNGRLYFSYSVHT